jgi:hypothetical protein
MNAPWAILALAAGILLPGCMALSVPRTVIRGEIAGQPFELVTPKDSELTDLLIEVRGTDAWGGSNYTAVSIGGLRANMNPQVITTTADGQVKLIQAVGSELRATGAAAIK